MLILDGRYTQFIHFYINKEYYSSLLIVLFVILSELNSVLYCLFFVFLDFRSSICICQIIQDIYYLRGQYYKAIGSM